MNKAAFPKQYKRNARTLWILILVAVLYLVLLSALPTLTSRPMLDGAIGVALGLYICAHPAANAINLLFFERDIARDALRSVRSDWPLIRWLALNLFVLLVGWMVVFAGIRRLIARPA
jgi:hypothetical protein